MEDNDPQGHATLLDRLPLIRKSNLDPSSLATELYSKKLITYDVKEEVDAITTKRKKLGRIVEGVMENGDSGVFQKFVAIVRRDPAHKWLADILEGKAQPTPSDQGPSQPQRGATGKAQPTPSGQGPSQREATDKFFTDKEEKILDDFAKRVIKKYNVDSSPLDRRLHFPYVRSALIEVADKWENIGSVLGLTGAELNAIKANNGKNVDQCLNGMILKWFEKSTSATLRQLVGAIATETGGENPAHAESVSKMFQGGLICDFPFAKKVDSTELTGDDSAEVKAALGDVQAKWKEIGIFLGLEIKKLNALDKMSEMVDMWLKKRYDITHFGDPSWQKLVGAVGSKAGAGDVAAAADIASKYETHPDSKQGSLKSPNLQDTAAPKGGNDDTDSASVSEVQQCIDGNPDANGLVVIVTNDYKDTKLGYVEECHDDGEEMMKTFKDTFKFACLRKKNRTSSAMKKLLADVGKCKYRSYKCIAVVFSGHGGEGILKGNDGINVSVEEEWLGPLQMTDVPKLFFINACRGSLELKSLGEGSKKNKINSLVMYATIEGHTVYVDAKWMQKIAKKLRDENDSVQNIASDVIDELEDWKLQQWPEYKSSCRRVNLHKMCGLSAQKVKED